MYKNKQTKVKGGVVGRHISKNHDVLAIHFNAFLFRKVRSGSYRGLSSLITVKKSLIRNLCEFEMR